MTFSFVFLDKYINCYYKLTHFTEEKQSNLHCPRMHGYFAHEDPKICSTFYYCVEGKFNMITCPDGLVFSPKTGICNWPDEAQKKGCGSRELFNFTCPAVSFFGNKKLVNIFHKIIARKPYNSFHSDFLHKSNRN